MKKVDPILHNNSETSDFQMGKENGKYFIIFKIIFPVQKLFGKIYLLLLYFSLN